MAEHQSLLRPRDEENDDASSQNRFASSFTSSKTWTKVLAGSGALVLAATFALSGIKSNSSSSLTSSGGTRSHHLGGEAASVQPNASIKLHTAEQPAALGGVWAGEGADGLPIKTWFCNKCKKVMDNRQSYSVVMYEKCVGRMFEYRYNMCTREEWNEKFCPSSSPDDDNCGEGGAGPISKSLCGECKVAMGCPYKGYDGTCYAGADAGLGSFISESNGFISAGEGDESTQRHPDRSKETCSKCENLMYDWKSNTCTREEWESTPKHEKFYCTIRKPDRVRYAEAKNRCVEKVHEAQKDCMKDRDCPLNHDFFQCCAAKAIGGDNGGIDSYCSRGKMEERGVRW